MLNFRDWLLESGNELNVEEIIRRSRLRKISSSNLISRASSQAKKVKYLSNGEEKLNALADLLLTIAQIEALSMAIKLDD